MCHHMVVLLIVPLFHHLFSPVIAKVSSTLVGCKHADNYIAHFPVDAQGSGGKGGLTSVLIIPYHLHITLCCDCYCGAHLPRIIRFSSVFAIGMMFHALTGCYNLIFTRPFTFLLCTIQSPRISILLYPVNVART